MTSFFSVLHASDNLSTVPSRLRRSSQVCLSGMDSPVQSMCLNVMGHFIAFDTLKWDLIIFSENIIPLDATTGSLGIAKEIGHVMIEFNLLISVMTVSQRLIR